MLEVDLIIFHNANVFKKVVLENPLGSWDARLDNIGVLLYY